MKQGFLFQVRVSKSILQNPLIIGVRWSIKNLYINIYIYICDGIVEFGKLDVTQYGDTWILLKSCYQM
jgi:hypothetical protein